MGTRALEADARHHIPCRQEHHYHHHQYYFYSRWPVTCNLHYSLFVYFPHSPLPSSSPSPLHLPLIHFPSPPHPLPNSLSSMSHHPLSPMTLCTPSLPSSPRGHCHRHKNSVTGSPLVDWSPRRHRETSHRVRFLYAR